MTLYEYYLSLGETFRPILVVLLAAFAHLIVYGVRRVANWIMSLRFQGSLTKTRTITSLVSSTLMFVIYFGAFGIALSELGVPIQAYLASASVVGLAIAFGSQGLVQDVMSGLTIVFTGLFDVGDMVELGGQTGIVQRLGMRYTVMTNALGAEVYVPNRSITNVVSYPRGYVRCLADITLSDDADILPKMEAAIRDLANGVHEQFPGILLTPPDIEGLNRTSSGRQFIRLKFRIWPGRGGPIETNFRQEVVQALRQFDSDYAEWKVAINYEVEQKQPLQVNWYGSSMTR